MAASFMTRVGLLNDLPKFQPTQPGARFLGSFTMRPFLTGAGKPIEMASYFQPSAVFLTCEISCRGESFMPESNFRFSLREIMSFTCVPPMSMTRIFFFMKFLSARW
jgi:hypothetical protein